MLTTAQACKLEFSPPVFVASGETGIPTIAAMAFWPFSGRLVACGAMRLSSGVAPAWAIVGRGPRGSGLRADGSSPRFGATSKSCALPMSSRTRCNSSMMRSRRFIVDSRQAAPQAYK